MGITVVAAHRHVHGVVRFYGDVYSFCIAIVMHLCLYWFAGVECQVLKQTIREWRTVRSDGDVVMWPSNAPSRIQDYQR